MARTAAADKREIILQAAVKAFAKRGFHGTRVSDIATEAGIAYGLIYHYFKNKDEILNAIFREKWNLFLAILRNIDQDNGDLQTKLQAIAGFFIDSYRQLPELMEVLILEILHSSRFLEKENLAHFQEAFTIMEGIFRRAQKDGILAREVDPFLSSLIFLGSIETAITARILKTVPATYLNELKVQLVNQFLYGIATQRPAAT